MTFYKQNQGWLIGLGAWVMLLWTAQFSANWFKPRSDIELVQYQKIELAHTIQFEWNEYYRSSKLESDSDSTAHIVAYATTDAVGQGLSLGPDTTTTSGKFQSSRLPGIRAPPHHIPSA